MCWVGTEAYFSITARHCRAPQKMFQVVQPASKVLMQFSSLVSYYGDGQVAKLLLSSHRYKQ
jgi:hypothetical protein